MRTTKLIPLRPLLVAAGICTITLVSACGTDEETDNPTANDAQSDNDVSIDGSATESDTSACEGATDRFWPDTAACDPSCYYLVDGLMFDEARGCYGPSAELSTPLACLRDGTAGASLSCHDVPRLGQVMTLNEHAVIYAIFEDCWMERQQGFPCTE